MSRKAVCPCPYCDPLLWTQAHSMAASVGIRGGIVNNRGAQAVGLLARLVEDALHPEHSEEARAEAREARP